MTIIAPPAYGTRVNGGHTTQSEALPTSDNIHRRALSTSSNIQRRPVPPKTASTANVNRELDEGTTEKHGRGLTEIPPVEYSTAAGTYQPGSDSNVSRSFTAQSVQSHQDELSLEEVRCSLLPHRPAVWSIQAMHVKLSTLAATILMKENILKHSDLQLMNVLQKNGADTKSSEPTDPISGVLSAVNSTIGGVLMGLADYPIEISRMAKREKSQAKGMAVNFATDKGKGVSRIVGTGLRAPMDYSMALSKGFHNLPKAYHDTTVREFDRVVDVQSGLSVAGKSFGYGLYDGITGLVTQPVKGAKNGAFGAVKGVGKGLGGLICKPVAGACGLPAYTLKGFYEQMHKKRGAGESLMEDILIAQGMDEWISSTEEVRDEVIRRWYETQDCPKYE